MCHPNFSRELELIKHKKMQKQPSCYSLSSENLIFYYFWYSNSSGNLAKMPKFKSSIFLYSLLLSLNSIFFSLVWAYQRAFFWQSKPFSQAIKHNQPLYLYYIIIVSQKNDSILLFLFFSIVIMMHMDKNSPICITYKLRHDTINYKATCILKHNITFYYMFKTLSTSMTPITSYPWWLMHGWIHVYKYVLNLCLN